MAGPSDTLLDPHDPYAADSEYHDDDRLCTVDILSL